MPKRREGSSPFERTIFLPKNCIFSQAPFFVNASVCFHLAKKVSEMRLNYRPVPHLDPALRARLQSALQRPDLKPTTRAKIESLLNSEKPNSDEQKP